MKKILNISFALCMLGAMSSLFYSIDPGDSIQSSEVFRTHGDSLNGEQDSAILSRSYLFLLFAEINHEVPSEIDPQKSFSVNWSSKQNKPDLHFQYLIRSQRLSVSQSIRTLIYPFHSFL
jgi:hypothetical protein